LAPLLPRKRYATLSDAVLEVARAMQVQEDRDANLVCIMNWVIQTVCEVSPRGHAHDENMETFKALTELPATMIVRGFKLVGFNVVVVEDVQYFSGAAEGRSGYLKLKRAPRSNVRGI